MRSLVARVWLRRWLLPHLVLPSLPYLLLAAVVPVDVLMTRHGDLNLYFDVSRRMLGGELPYRDIPLEYPPLALTAFLLPRLVSTDLSLSVGHYVVLFAIENALLVLAASLVLVRLAARWRPRRRVTTTLAVWTLVVIVTAPIVPWRHDLLPAVLALLGVLSALLGGPLAAGLWLGLGAAAKLYPAVLLPVLLLGYLALRDGRSMLAVAGSFAAGAVAPLLPFLLADGGSALHFLEFLKQRGIQLESFPSGLIGVARNLGLVEANVTFEFGSWQVNTELSEVILRLQTLLLILALAGFAALAYRRFREEALATGGISAPTLVGQSLAVILLVVGLGKVFSPQYVAWFLPFLPLLAWRQLTLGVAICLLTVAIYPVLYADSLVGMEPMAVLVLNLRNLAVLGLAAWLVLERPMPWAIRSVAPAAPPADPAGMLPAPGAIGRWV